MSFGTHETRSQGCCQSFKSVTQVQVLYGFCSRLEHGEQGKGPPGRFYDWCTYLDISIPWCRLVQRQIQGGGEGGSTPLGPRGCPLLKLVTPLVWTVNARPKRKKKFETGLFQRDLRPDMALARPEICCFLTLHSLPHLRPSFIHSRHFPLLIWTPTLMIGRFLVQHIQIDIYSIWAYQFRISWNVKVSVWFALLDNKNYINFYISFSSVASSACFNLSIFSYSIYPGNIYSSKTFDLQNIFWGLIS